jgi:hypothetical protein
MVYRLHKFPNCFSIHNSIATLQGGLREGREVERAVEVSGTSLLQ